jgi:hypothetical protein
LKLRVSYGQTGNDRIPANATKFLFEANTNNGPGMGTNAYNAYYSPEGETLYNPNILWETTINRNLGLDFTLFNYAINGNVDLYMNTTRDLLLASAISPISGFPTQWKNIGSTSNKGIEMLLNALIVQTDDFRLSASLNFGINKANIDALDGTDERFFQSNWSSTDLKDRDDYYLSVGETIGGFGLDATFKGFDASILFNWSYGNDVYNSGKIIYNQLYRTRYGNMISSMSSDKRFTYIDVDGSITGTAGAVVTDLEQLRQLNEGKTIWSGNNSFGQATTVIHDWAVEDGSFLRLSTATLGYTVPDHISRKIGVSQLRVYATGYNIWLWTNYSGYDPEVSTSRSSSYPALTPGLDYSSYPRSRSYTIGLNVTF